MTERRCPWIQVSLAIVAVFACVTPAEAQRDYEPLFEKFNLRLEGSWVGLATEIRLDSELLGRGTTLSFEDDLDLDASKIIPTFAFEWQIARKHRLGLRYQQISRDSTAQALTEIQWGGEIIPIDATVVLGFDIDQAYLDYTYFPWVKENWAAGFGLGFRVMTISASLSYEGEEVGGSDEAEGTGPLPYVYFEYRRLIGEHWRLMAGLGWLEVSIGDIDGGQRVGRVGAEYLLGRHWGFGGALNLSNISIDWAGLQTDAGESALSAAIDIDVNDFSVFVRYRF